MHWARNSHQAPHQKSSSSSFPHTFKQIHVPIVSVVKTMSDPEREWKKSLLLSEKSKHQNVRWAATYVNFDIYKLGLLKQTLLEQRDFDLQSIIEQTQIYCCISDIGRRAKIPLMEDGWAVLSSRKARATPALSTLCTLGFGTLHTMNLSPITSELAEEQLQHHVPWDLLFLLHSRHKLLSNEE